MLEILKYCDSHYIVKYNDIPYIVAYWHPKDIPVNVFVWRWKVWRPWEDFKEDDLPRGCRSVEELKSNIEKSIVAKKDRLDEELGEIKKRVEKVKKAYPNSDKYKHYDVASFDDDEEEDKEK